MGNIAAARKLKEDIGKAILRWNERSMFRLKGIGNLSRSDMDLLDFFADHYLRNGNVRDLLAYGGVKQVLEAYGLL